MTLEQLEKDYILKTLTEKQGNKTEAAKSLGITVKTLYNKLHKYGVFDQFSANATKVEGGKPNE